MEKGMTTELQNIGRNVAKQLCELQSEVHFEKGKSEHSISAVLSLTL